jgi:DNA polymerase III epsilon subunit-like protein
MLDNSFTKLTEVGLDSWAFVDIETSGGKRHVDEITEIALIHVCEGEVVERFQTLLKPTRSIPPWITEFIGISNAISFQNLVISKAIQKRGSK